MNAGLIDTSSLRRAVPKAVLDICECLNAHGHAAWVVGGCVRDQLLQIIHPAQAPRAPGDWDIATSALPQVVQKLFRKVIPTGLEHGTVTVLMDKVPYEVTTFRAEAGYVDGRRPGQVVFLDDITADLGRRDFTVNAIAYDPLSDRFADPYAGVADLRARLIRAVGEPSERFGEDGLRVLRAARFVSTLEFQLDDATASAIEPSLDSYRRVSAERIRDEWFKALKTRKPSLAFNVMARHGLLDVSVPELARHTATEEWDFTLTWVDACAPRPEVRLAALFSPLLEANDAPPMSTRGTQKVERILLRLKLSNQERNRVLALLMHLELPTVSASSPDLRRWLRQVTPALVPDLFALAESRPNASSEQRDEVGLLKQRVMQLLSDCPALSVKDLAIDGKDLMAALSLTPGKHLGELLNHLLEAVTDAPELNTRSALLERARTELQLRQGA